jgi:DNA-binding NarL/FixJ family response regulator
LREGLKTIISRDSTYTVVGEAGSACEALEVITREQPEIAVLDISLPDASGIEVCKKLRKELPETKVLIVSMHAHQEYIVAAFEAGALGYVTKETTADRLLEALRVVEDGEMFIDHVCTREIIERLLRAEVKAAQASGHGDAAVTGREREVISLLASGLTTKEVADRLMISEKTASNHRTNIMQKLGFGSIVDLVRYAEKNGLVPGVEWERLTRDGPGNEDFR